jgi:hypothetical protein
MKQSVKFGERYTSEALNRKVSGVLSAGVYYGFNIAPGGGRFIQLEKDEDFPGASVAVVERDGFSITVYAKDVELVEVPAMIGSVYVCIQAVYLPEQQGYQEIVFRTAPEDHHIVLGKLTLIEGFTEITAEMISEEGRTVGNPLLWLMDVSTKFVTASTEIMGLQYRMTNLENWAKASGFDPETVYSGNPEG